MSVASFCDPVKALSPRQSCQSRQPPLDSPPFLTVPVLERVPRACFRPEVVTMPFIIAEPCIGVKDKSCVEVCPVNCIYEGEDQFYIHPDECIDCQACEAACPVQAIFPDNSVPEKWAPFIDKNRKHFENK